MLISIGDIKSETFSPFMNEHVSTNWNSGKESCPELSLAYCVALKVTKWFSSDGVKVNGCDDSVRTSIRSSLSLHGYKTEYQRARQTKLMHESNNYYLYQKVPDHYQELQYTMHLPCKPNYCGHSVIWLTGQTE